MATGTVDESDEDDFYKMVLDTSQFVSDLDPTSLLHKCVQEVFIDYEDYRDITEESKSSEKYRKIVEAIHKKGEVKYELFKQFLRHTNQEHLAAYLENYEQKKKKVQSEAMQYREIPQKAENISDKDLVTIALSIGNNWELLAPVFDISEDEIDRLKRNNNTVEKQIYGMLRIWKKRHSESSLDSLLSMIQSVRAVQVDMDFINKNVSYPVMNRIHKRQENASAMSQNEQSQIRLQQRAFPADQTRDGVTPKQEQAKFLSSNVYGVTPIQDVSLDDINSKFPRLNLIKRTKIDANVITEHSTNQRSENAQHNSKAYLASGPKVIESAPIHVSEKGDPKYEMAGTTFQDSRVSKKTAALPHDSLSVIDLNSKSGRQNNETGVGQQTESNEPKMSKDLEKRLEEAFTPPRDKPRRKCTHDGRLLMRDETVFHTIKGCCKTIKPIEGGFGTVHLSEDKIPGLKIKVALKELKCHDDSTQIENSAENEKLASRIMHFAIVPLLAMGTDTAKRTIWFLYPRLVMGDLKTLIETDTRRIENNKMPVELDRKTRLRIIYHVSAAIDFLHTEIKNLRGAILHLDVKTSNIVLDQCYNARLADFGVARETSGNKTSIKTSFASIPCTHGYFEPQTDTLEKSFDYYNFGVVIREMLTGQPPYFRYPGNLEDDYLKVMEDSLLEFYIKLQKSMWYTDEKMCKAARTLLELSSKCIKGADKTQMNEAKEKLTSTLILKEMKGVIRTFCDGDTWKRLPPDKQQPEDDNCDMCMINPAVAEDLMTHASICRCPLKVCLSCMRNSYLNPLRCHSCFQESEPVIGSKCGAVLVAGHYDNDKTFSDSCAGDVADMHKVLTSKCPLVIGIREEFVRTITQCNKGTLTGKKDTVSSQICSELNALKKSCMRTILFYYSGHYSKEDNFMLRKVQDDNENMSLSDFKVMIKAVLTGDKSKNVKNIIVILDCCQAPIILTDQIGFHEDMYLNIVQLNACRPNEAALQEPHWFGSVFKKLFIQALTMKSTEDDCILQGGGRRCKICPFENDDYITIGSLNSYIGRHMEKFQENRGQEGCLSVQYAATDVKIAYVVESSAKLNFTLSFKGRKEDYSINCKFINNICQLKNELFHEFMEKMKGDKKEITSQVELKAEAYRDILRIVIQKGPRDKHKHEVCTLEQVMCAWNGKRELFVELRNSVVIKDGIVGVFMDDIEKQLLSFFLEYKHEKEEGNNRITYRFKVEELNSLSMKERVLQDLQRGLITIQKDQKQQDAELHVISPCMIDGKGVRHVRDDFVCLNIHYKR